jgi:hypothetical protein
MCFSFLSTFLQSADIYIYDFLENDMKVSKEGGTWKYWVIGVLVLVIVVMLFYKPGVLMSPSDSGKSDNVLDNVDSADPNTKCPDKDTGYLELKYDQNVCRCADGTLKLIGGSNGSITDTVGASNYCKSAVACNGEVKDPAYGRVDDASTTGTIPEVNTNGDAFPLSRSEICRDAGLNLLSEVHCDPGCYATNAEVKLHDIHDANFSFSGCRVKKYVVCKEIEKLVKSDSPDEFKSSK